MVNSLYFLLCIFHFIYGLLILVIGLSTVLILSSFALVRFSAGDVWFFNLMNWKPEMKAHFDGSFRGSNTRDSDWGMRYLHTRKHTHVYSISNVQTRKFKKLIETATFLRNWKTYWKNEKKKKRIDQNIDIKDHSVANSWFDLNDSYVSTMRQI